MPNWKDTAELVGIAAIVASLVFVGLELQQSQRIAIAEQEGAQVIERIERDAFLSAHAELIAKLNAGDEVSEAEQIQVNMVIDVIYGHAFFSYRRWDYLDHPAVAAPARHLAKFLNENPGLRDSFLRQLEVSLTQNEFLGVNPSQSAIRNFLNDVKGNLAVLDGVE